MPDQIRFNIQPAHSNAVIASVPEFLTNDQVADLLGLSPRTTERFRLEGRGPSYHKFGRIVRYSRAAVLDWVAQQMRTSTAEVA
jgi:excisionase family DNA binding protein